MSHLDAYAGSSGSDRCSLSLTQEMCLNAGSDERRGPETDTDRDLEVWNGFFHDGGIESLKGHVPGDIEATINPGLGNRKYFPDPGEKFVVVMRNCTECTLTNEDKNVASHPVYDLEVAWGDARCSLIDAWREGNYLVLDTYIGELKMKYDTLDLYLDSGRLISYEELGQSVDRWWKHWREYWDQKTRAEFEAPLEAGGPHVSVISYSIEKDPNGINWASVLIKNIGGAPAHQPKVQLTAMQDGQAVTTGSGSLWFDSILEVGQTVSVRFWVSNDIPPGSSIEWATTSKRPARQRPKLTLTESNLSLDPAGNVAAVGTIRNDDELPVKGVRAIASFLNTEGEILYSSNGWADLTQLESGQTTAFRVETPCTSADVTTVQVYITGYHPR